MSKFENIGYEIYDESKVSREVKILAAVFNAAADAVHTGHPIGHPQSTITDTIETAKAIFQDIKGDKEPVLLMPSDQTYLMLNFIQIAGKLNTRQDPTSLTSTTAVEDLSKDSKLLFDAAMEYKLIMRAPRAPADLL